MEQAVEATEVGAAKAAPLLNINNIEVIYDHVILVLKGVSLELYKGGIVALLGANGAGKSTTLKAISNLLRAEDAFGDGEYEKKARHYKQANNDSLSRLLYPKTLIR